MMMMMKSSLPSVLLLLLFGTSAQAQLNNAGVIQSDDRLTKLVQLLDRAGLSPSVGVTILAPSTDAFNNFRENDISIWNKYAQQSEWFIHLRDLLLWHFVTDGPLTFEDIFNGGRKFLENSNGNITIDQQIQMLDNVPATSFAETNISTSDGIVHVIDKVIIPPYLGQNLIPHLLDDRHWDFAFSTMANIALNLGLDEEINRLYENGLTFLVPPNRRFNRAEIDVPSLMTEEMRSYATDFVRCHMIMDNYYEAGIFAFNQENQQSQFLVKSMLGTSLWITTTENKLRFQSTDVVLADQAARNGYVATSDTY
jgi:uncharacterized surface protein with fasciclin (FAS1) repeats